MRLITRNDTSLAVGLIVGTVVAFRQPLHFVLDVAQDVENRYHIDLLPALTVVAGVFTFHQYRKRLLIKAEAQSASAEAARARARSEELERLMTFSQDLARVLNVGMLQQVLWKNLPSVGRDRAFWVLARNGGRWHEVAQDAIRTHTRSIESLQAMSDVALANTGATATAAGIPCGDDVCFPLIAGEDAVGVLGIDAGGGLAPDDRRTLGAAAALIAIALRNVQLFDETRAHSVHDRLTGCFNHEQGLETLDAELRRAKRSGRPLAIVMFDIDHFKSINDRFGHMRGDDILRAVGAQFTRVLRTSDVSCRYGGDEFLLILPETDRDGAVRVAEILLSEIATLAIARLGEDALKVTASIGVAMAAPGEIAVAALVKRADDALYQSKAAGRNRLTIAPLPVATPAADTREPGAAAPAPAAAALRGAETILVADDEPLIHEMVRQILEPRGYTILSAKNGAAAIALGQGHRGSIALLLTDMVMPDLRGPELVERILELRPAIKVVYMSGFSDHLNGLGPDAACLDKPFTPASLSTAVRQTLDA